VSQSHRLPDGGRIDRSRSLSFLFDGNRYEGHPGDTLASALIANGVHLVGRSFKYHRPRGIFSAGSEEPNALIQLGLGNHTEPNLRAPQIELYDGLVATSQNRFPSLAFDLGEVNDIAAPLIPSGFYYKTFMWPKRGWMSYERAIRRMAGLGRAPDGPDPDTYEHRHAHCDVLVAGGGVTGLAAALAAGRAGARVILADEQAEMGGWLLSEGDGETGTRISGKPVADWVEKTVAELAAMENVTLLRRTTAFGYYDHNWLGLAERVTDHLGPFAPAHLPRQRLWKVRAKQVVLAAGAIERPLVFSGNDRPGILLSGAVRSYVARYGTRPGNALVVVTSNDSGYLTALEAHRAGIGVAAIVDTRPTADGALPQAARKAGLRIYQGHGVIGTTGRLRVDGVRLAKLSANGGRIEGKGFGIPCDLVAMSGGWNPNVSLFSQSRGKLNFREADGVFVPGEATQPLRSAGMGNGVLSTADCLAEGFAAGAAAANDTGFTARKAPSLKIEEPEVPAAAPIWLLPPEKPLARAKCFVDFQNDVTAADLKLAAREGFRSVEHVKRYTTTGMGTDQGRTSNVNALAILSATLGQDIPAVGTTTFRPPYTPVAFGAIAGRNIGRLFDPVRRTPIHDWHEANGAKFENVGQWVRAWYYPKAGETLHAAVNREVKAARTTVGILDASTLGKIEVKGPDAAEFLNRIYTNAWLKLGIGKARYGLMLREDGMVFDDGVTVRLAEDRFLMSTTTGNAAQVLVHLEDYLQTEWPDMKVYLTSVTEQYATITINGPKSRDLLASLTNDIDTDNEAFPHMSLREGTVAGIPARVIRISFTGELSYEINVRASRGQDLWEALMQAGEPFGITPYGTEAMHVLRAEKGFIIVGQETDGSMTPDDLGMGWIVSKVKPDFVGKRSLARSDTMREGRKQLVGLLTEDPKEVLEEGAHVVETVLDKPPMPMLGHVTSSYYSPNAGRSIALAVLQGGRALVGKTLSVPMADRIIKVTVTEPVFFDPKGERANG